MLASIYCHSIDLGRTQEDFIKAQPFRLAIPRVRSQEIEQSFAHIAERRQILAIYKNEIGTNLLCLRDEHELLDIAATRIVVAGGQDVLLLNAERL